MNCGDGFRQNRDRSREQGSPAGIVCIHIPNIIDYGTVPPRPASTAAVYWLLVDAERGDIKETKWGRDGWRMARRYTGAPRCANTSCVARNQPPASASARVRPRPPTRSSLLVSPY